MHRPRRPPTKLEATIIGWLLVAQFVLLLVMFGFAAAIAWRLTN